MKKLNILFVSEYFYPRKAGGEVWAWELCTELAKKHKVTVITTRHENSLKKEETAEGVHILRPVESPQNISNRVRRYMAARRLNKYVEEYVRRNRKSIDVMHIMAYGVNVGTSRTARKHEVPSITSVHSYFGGYWSGALSPILRLLERRNLAKDQSQIMHVPSAYLQKRIKKEVGKETAVIHNWIPERFPKPKKLPKNALLFVGSLEPIKNPLACIAVAKRLNAPLFVIGKGSLEKKLLREAARADIALVLIPEASHEETLSYIGGASLVLVPSITESFSLVALEAVAQGTPVSGPPVGILPDIPHAPFPPEAIPLDPHASVRKQYAKKRLVSEIEELYRKVRR